jgi:hypothetical protein
MALAGKATLRIEQGAGRRAHTLGDALGIPASRKVGR